jgi:predicted RNase H-like HicB family nuclease
MTDISRYLILVEGGPPSNYSAWSPDVSGCVATGSTVDACVRSMRDALEGHLAWIARDGDPLPPARGPGVYIDIAHAA